MCLCFHELPLEIFTRGEHEHEHEHEVAASPAVVIVEKNRVFRLNETASNLGWLANEMVLGWLNFLKI